MNAKLLSLALCIALCAGSLTLGAEEPDALGGVPTIKIPSLVEVQKLAFDWLDAQQATPEVRTAANEIWRTDGGPHATDGALDRLAATLALADPRAQALIEICAGPRSAGPQPTPAWLLGDEGAALVRNNLRLYYGRWLSQQRLYDESLEQLATLEPADVVDPAGLLFYQSVAHHRLLNKEQGLKSIGRLLSEVIDGPTRYVAVAGLMREDLKALEDDSLDHIARRMDDVRRRLDLGRAGDKVRKQEDGVVASLDKLIEEMEKQQQQQQQQQSSSGGNPNPTQGMPDSRPAELKGTGVVDRRNVGRGVGWGDLPAKQREDALQQIGKDFPSNYRDVIEEYFRKLAADEEKGDK